MAQDSIISGLFGLTPEMYQRSQAEEDQKAAMQFARLSPLEQASAGFYSAGMGLGRGIGTLLGAEDPQLQRIANFQNLKSQFDISTPKGLSDFSNALLKSGDVQSGMVAAKLSDELLQREAASQSRQRSLQAQGLLPSLVTKATPENAEEGVPARPETVNREVLSQLESTPEGRELLKSVRGEFKVVDGQIVRIPLFGEPTVVAGAQKPIVVGSALVDPVTYKVLYQKPDALPGEIAEFNAFRAMPPQDQKSFLQFKIAGKPATNINLPTEGERKAGTLLNRLSFGFEQMRNAIKIDPSAQVPKTNAEIARFLTRSEFLPNVLVPAQRQIVESAQLDMLDAALTLGTGAAYTREQLEGYRKAYFPQVGDKKENIEAKQKRLENLIRSAKIAAGRSAPLAERPPLESFEKPEKP